MIRWAVILCWFTFGAEAQTLNSFLRNREGLKQLENKSYLPANREFSKALEDDPLNPAVQMNLGLTYEANEEYDKAAAAYRGVLNLAPEGSTLRFQALFNVGEVSAKAGKIDQALSAYQAALEINPDSLEVKNNIELLWMQGQGGGKGENKDQKDQQKDQKGDNQKQREQSLSQKDEPQKKSQPKPFDSQDLSKEDVKRILDEIKNQEQSIRASEYEKNLKERARDKDW